LPFTSDIPPQGHWCLTCFPPIFFAVPNIILFIAFIKHTPAIATESFLLTYSFHSQHVSALTGHIQVNRNILYVVTHLQKTIATSTDPLF
jgi:hypothetical protein